MIECKVYVLMKTLSCDKRGTRVPLELVEEFIEVYPHAELAMREAIESHTSDALRVTWEFWKITQSEYHYRETGETDLGEID